MRIKKKIFFWGEGVGRGGGGSQGGCVQRMEVIVDREKKGGSG